MTPSATRRTWSMFELGGMRCTSSVPIPSNRRAVTAVQADPDERARLWPLLVQAYADFDSY